MKQTLTITLIVFLLSALLYAQNEQQITGYAALDSKEQVYSLLEEAIVYTNHHHSKIPALIKTTFGNERINGEIILKNNDKLVVGIEASGGIMRLRRGKLRDPTLEVVTTEEVFYKIYFSDEPSTELADAVRKNEIAYHPVGTRNRIKYGTTGYLLLVLSKLKREDLRQGSVDL